MLLSSRWYAFYKVYGSLAFRVRSSPASVRLLFGFDPDEVPALHGGYWDWGTLALRQALQRLPLAGKSMLDMGTGAIGVLAMFAALRLKTKRVCASDVMPENLAGARSLARKTGLQIDFVQSDLFQSIDGVFDVIVFNPPYIDTETGRVLGIYPNARSEARSNGGKFGLEVIARFREQAPDHLAPGGFILLGMSNFHMPARQTEKLLASVPFQAVKQTGRLPLPSWVCMLRASR